MGCSVGFKYAKNALAVGALPWTPLGGLTTLPRHLSQLGRGHQSQCPTPSALRPALDLSGVGVGSLTSHWLTMTPTLVTQF